MMRRTKTAFMPRLSASFWCKSKSRQDSSNWGEYLKLLLDLLVILGQEFKEALHRSLVKAV